MRAISNLIRRFQIPEESSSLRVVPRISGTQETATDFLKRVAPPLLHSVAASWVPCLDTFILACRQADQSVHAYIIEIVHCGLRIILRLMSSGYAASGFLNDIESIVPLMPDLVERLLMNMQNFMACSEYTTQYYFYHFLGVTFPTHPLVSHCLRQVTKITKCLVTIQVACLLSLPPYIAKERQPALFAPFLFRFLSFYWDFLEFYMSITPSSFDDKMAIAAISYYHFTINCNSFTVTTVAM